MEMQKTVARLDQSVTTLTENFKKDSGLLNEISHKMFAAQVVVSIVGALLVGLGGVAVWFLNKIWDTILPLVQIIPPP